MTEAVTETTSIGRGSAWLAGDGGCRWIDGGDDAVLGIGEVDVISAEVVPFQ